MAADIQNGANETGAQRAGFPYAEKLGEELQQGDVLELTNELNQRIPDIRSSHDEISHAIVLTQSCDLVRRSGGDCRAGIIALAPIVPFASVVRQEIAKSQLDDLSRTAGVAPSKSRQRTENFVERVLNNNEADYFFLRSEGSIGLNEDRCALLRRPVTTDATNYDVCLRARLASLSEIFQARLGWSVGHLYSRVATEDWVPKYASAPQFTTMIRQHLESECRWHEEERLRLARESLTPEIVKQGREALREHIRLTKIPSRRDAAIARIEHFLRSLLGGASIQPADEIVEKLKQRLLADPVFQSATKK